MTYADRQPLLTCTRSISVLDSLEDGPVHGGVFEMVVPAIVRVDIGTTRIILGEACFKGSVGGYIVHGIVGAGASLRGTLVPAVELIAAFNMRPYGDI